MKKVLVCESLKLSMQFILNQVMVANRDMDRYRCILAGNSLDSFIQLIGTLLIFLFVLVITYFVAKWMGGLQQARMKSHNLNLIETIPVGNNKTIGIVEAGEVYLVVSIGKDEIHLLKELSVEQLKDTSFLINEENKLSRDSFQSVMAEVKNKLQKKQG